MFETTTLRKYTAFVCRHDCSGVKYSATVPSDFLLWERGEQACILWDQWHLWWNRRGKTRRFVLAPVWEHVPIMHPAATNGRSYARNHFQFSVEKLAIGPQEPPYWWLRTSCSGSPHSWWPSHPTATLQARHRICLAKSDTNLLISIKGPARVDGNKQWDIKWSFRLNISHLIYPSYPRISQLISILDCQYLKIFKDIYSILIYT